MAGLWRSRGAVSAQLLQQRLRIFEVRRIKPFRKPAVHRCQQVTGVLALALGLPQAGQAGGGTEFEGGGGPSRCLLQFGVIGRIFRRGPLHH
jgi:hypothetical protein